MQREVQVQRVPEYLRVPPLFITRLTATESEWGPGLPSTSALGPGPSIPTSAPRLRSPLPHLHRKRLRSNRHEDRRTGLFCSPCGLRSPTISEARAEGPSRRRVGNCPNAEACGIICTRLRSSPLVGLYGRAASVGRYKLSKGDDLDDDDEDDDDDAPRVKRIRGRCALPPRQRPTDPINLHKLASFRVVGRPFRCCCCPVCVVWRRVHYSATSASPLRSLDWGLRSSRAKLGRTAALARRSYGLSRGGRRTELGVHSSNSTEHTLLGRQPDLRGRSEAVIERRAVN
jgi:hypothetical protein